MKQVNVHYAKTHLSSLLKEALEGEEIVIAKSGEAMARIVPIESKKRKRKLGLDKGKTKVPDDFDDELSEIIDLFDYDK